MSSKLFYKNLNYINKFIDSYDETMYKDVPEDWYIIITDIENSTKAIEQGKYKEVNIAGALSIIAIGNFIGTLEFPFVFGGDGVSMLVHKDYIEKSKKALKALQNNIKNNFDLNLRAGYISIEELRKKNLETKIAKFKVSNCYYQALLKGNGYLYAESAIKKGDYSLDKDYIEFNEKDLNVDGFSCRWQDIPAKKDNQLALIIKILDNEHQNKILKDLLIKIYEILGTEENWHPILKEEDMQTIPLNSPYVNLEAKLTSKLYYIQKYFIKLQILMVNFFGKFKKPIGIKVNYQDISRMRHMNYVSSDFRKYDNTLKLILNISNKEKVELFEYLNELSNQKKIIYGYYEDSKAHITCLVNLSNKEDVHFIDVINGGFTNAAKMLKERENLLSV